jgi:hypothetical protein
MKRILNSNKKILFLLLLLTALGVGTVSAQPDSETLFEPVTDTPVNAGIAVMVVAGIGYGMKKLNQRKK